MRHRKILKRENGNKIQLSVYLEVTTREDEKAITWNWHVSMCPPGKRKFQPVFDSNSYEYRKQPFPDGQKAYEKSKMLEHVSREEVLQARMELWEMIKPTL